MAKRKAYKPRIKPKPPVAKAQAKSSLWDLYRDGITYSLLCKFDECPERFRKRVVEGWSETGLQDGLEFGNAFHHCMENIDVSPPEKITVEYQKNRFTKGDLQVHQREEFEKLMAMVEAAVIGHQKYWARDNLAKSWVAREQQFDLLYPIDDVSIRLRGKIDGLYREANQLWVFESKTKGEIDQEGLHRTLRQDLQTMLYCLAVRESYGEEAAGVLYDVIRRPSIRPRKDESLGEFAIRVKEDYQTRPEFYFHRWEVSLESNDLELWRTRMFDPLLRKVIQWWDSIKEDPFNPWNSPYHWQKPFGMFNPMASGRRGSFFEYITSGSHTNLKQMSTPFPELET